MTADPDGTTSSAVIDRRYRDAALYGIIDLGYLRPADAPRALREMVRGGVDLVQLRAKSQTVREIEKVGAELHRITSDEGVPLVINDHAEVAGRIGAEGLHIGQDDLSISAARKIAGPARFVGRSTHSLEQAIRAAAEGADYIGFGPIFATPTKPDYAPIGLEEIKAVHAAVQLPVFCIGGIKIENLPQVIAAGARRVVIVSGLLQAADIAEYARAAKALLNQPLEIRSQQ